MNYYATGKVYEKGPLTEGQSQSGNVWQRMTLVIDVAVGQYSKKVAFQVSTNNIKDVMSFNIGDKVEVGFDISSREWTNKEGVRSWFASVDLRSIKAAGMPENVQTIPSAPIPGAGPAQDDDLPFNM
jgi:hypothetical protein